MLESLYSNARLYDLMFPQPSGLGSKAQFYLDLAATTGRPVLELGCGTGSVLLPIAERGIACQGIDLSSDMLAQARAKFEASGVTAGLHLGDMTDFDLDERFGFVRGLELANSSARRRRHRELLSCRAPTPDAGRTVRLRCLQPECAGPGWRRWSAPREAALR
jgi:SAM-dependent methyltransferase